MPDIDREAMTDLYKMVKENDKYNRMSDGEKTFLLDGLMFTTELQINKNRVKIFDSHKDLFMYKNKGIYPKVLYDSPLAAYMTIPECSMSFSAYASPTLFKNYVWYREKLLLVTYKSHRIIDRNHVRLSSDYVLASMAAFKKFLP